MDHLLSISKFMEIIMEPLKLKLVTIPNKDLYILIILKIIIGCYN